MKSLWKVGLLTVLLLLTLTKCTKNTTPINLTGECRSEQNADGSWTVTVSVTNPSELYNIYDVRITTHFHGTESNDTLLHEMENIDILKPNETVTFTYNAEFNEPFEGGATTKYEYVKAGQ